MKTPWNMLGRQRQVAAAAGTLGPRTSPRRIVAVRRMLSREVLRRPSVELAAAAYHANTGTVPRSLLTEA